MYGFEQKNKQKLEVSKYDKRIVSFYQWRHHIILLIGITVLSYYKMFLLRFHTTLCRTNFSSFYVELLCPFIFISFIFRIIIFVLCKLHRERIGVTKFLDLSTTLVPFLRFPVYSIYCDGEERRDPSIQQSTRASLSPLPSNVVILLMTMNALSHNVRNRDN